MIRALRTLAALGVLPAALAAQDRPSRGIMLEAAYIGDAIGTAAGGIRRDVVYLDNLDLTLHLDGHRLFGWPGALGFIHVHSNRGHSPETLVGDAQSVSNIAARRAWRLYEAWLQQNLLDGRLSLLAGLNDLDSEFDVIQGAERPRPSPAASAPTSWPSAPCTGSRAAIRASRCSGGPAWPGRG